MKAYRTHLEGVLRIEALRHADSRGFFSETYTKRTFSGCTGRDWDFVQDNQSRSAKGVLRGLHYQVPPHAQGKLVRCVRGEVFDVAVDLRRSSSTFGGWLGIRLSELEPTQVWIPPGFAHGFLVLSESADIVYKVTDYYSPDCERSLLWNDPAIDIKWPDSETDPILSDKDRRAPRLDSAELFD